MSRIATVAWIALSVGIVACVVAAIIAGNINSQNAANEQNDSYVNLTRVINGSQSGEINTPRVEPHPLVASPLLTGAGVGIITFVIGLLVVIAGNNGQSQRPAGSPTDSSPPMEP